MLNVHINPYLSGFILIYIDYTVPPNMGWFRYFNLVPGLQSPVSHTFWTKSKVTVLKTHLRAFLRISFATLI